jgi:hypothetical protein
MLKCPSGIKNLFIPNSRNSISVLRFSTYRSNFNYKLVEILPHLTLNVIWVRALTGPMQLGLKTGPLCPRFTLTYLLI